MNDEAIEQEIQAKGANVAPRITPADVEANIASEFYFTAADAVAPPIGEMVNRFLGWELPQDFAPDGGITFQRESDAEPPILGRRLQFQPTGTNLLNASQAAQMFEHAVGKSEVPRSLHLLTICVLVLRNGFTVIGESACASPANFNAEIGRKIARENAVQKVWPLLGFALKERLHAEGG